MHGYSGIRSRERLWAALLACSSAVAMGGCSTQMYAGAGAASESSLGTTSDRLATTVTFVSGADWPSFAGDLGGPDGRSLGTAALVCVGPKVPPNCPAGAVLYRPVGTGWYADTSAFPAARWIWRGDVTPDAVGDLALAIFQKTFTLGSSPTGTIHIAADDFAEVRVNGSVAGSTGSVTSDTVAYAAQSTVATIDLSAYLVEGSNTITIVAQNGSFPGLCPSACTYAVNTAGVVFGGTLTYR